MSDTTPPLTLRPKVKVTRLNKLALVLAGSAAFLAGGALLYSSQQTTPAQEAPPKSTAIPAKNSEAWYSSIPDGLPSSVQAKPEPIPEPAQPPRVELPKDPQPPTIVPKEQTEAEQRMQQDLAAALRADTTVNAFTNSPQRSQSQPAQTAHQPMPETGMGQQAGGDHQDAKRQWLREAADSGKSDYLPSMVKKPISPYEVKAGSIIPAVMVMGINSDLPGQLVARVRETVYSSVNENIPLIPQGATLIGLYDSAVAYGQERLLVVWNRIIFPDGSSLNLKGQPGADMAGMSGFHDRVNNHYFRTFGGAILMSMISAGFQISQPDDDDDNGSPTATQIMAGALGQTLGQTASEMIQRNMNIAPTLEVRPGYPFNIVVTQDLILPGPYQYQE